MILPESNFRPVLEEYVVLHRAAVFDLLVV